MSLKKFNLLKDIYYNNDYISLYLKDNHTLFNFEYRENDKFFINKTIKREINYIGNVKVNGYYDLESAYGYGGFYTNTNDKIFIRKAMKIYDKKCKEENIIAEFMRFHPFNTFPLNNEEFFDFNIYDRDIVIVDLSKDILASYKSKVRNIVNRSLEKVDIKMSQNIDMFIELYNKTMDKNSADKFYYFSKEFYENMLLLDEVELYEVVYDNKIVAMGLFMFSQNLAHYHLSANSHLSYKLNTNYALLHKLFEVAKSKNIDYFVLGGGNTALIDDNLLKFKQKFSKFFKPFYISAKVYNREIYDKYNKIWQNQTDNEIEYFSKYRLEIK